MSHDVFKFKVIIFSDYFLKIVLQAYKIEVFQSGKFHSLEKRYSEFEELHKQVGTCKFLQPFSDQWKLHHAAFHLGHHCSAKIPVLKGLSLAQTQNHTITCLLHQHAFALCALQNISGL